MLEQVRHLREHSGFVLSSASDSLSLEGSLPWKAAGVNIGLSSFPPSLQKGDVRFLICTDVAARGIDIHGVPYGK